LNWPVTSQHSTTGMR